MTDFVTIIFGIIAAIFILSGFMMLYGIVPAALSADQADIRVLNPCTTSSSPFFYLATETNGYKDVRVRNQGRALITVDYNVDMYHVCEDFDLTYCVEVGTPNEISGKEISVELIPSYGCLECEPGTMKCYAGEDNYGSINEIAECRTDGSGWDTIEICDYRCTPQGPVCYTPPVEVPTEPPVEIPDNPIITVITVIGNIINSIVNFIKGLFIL